MRLSNSRRLHRCPLLRLVQCARRGRLFVRAAGLLAACVSRSLQKLLAVDFVRAFGSKGVVTTVPSGSVAVTPDGNLHAGEQVAVTVRGLSAHARLHVSECATIADFDARSWGMRDPAVVRTHRWVRRRIDHIRRAGGSICDAGIDQPPRYMHRSLCDRRVSRNGVERNVGLRTRCVPVACGQPDS